MIKAEILKILRDSKDYISGQELCTRLGVSRTAVWKVMKQLKEEGYDINAISNKGYKLQAQNDILSKWEIESRMETEVMGRRVIYFNEVDSTNIYAKKAAEEPNAEGVLIVAEMQNAGKGRRGKTWDSQEGTGIWMTLILKPDVPPENASMVTIIAGLAVASAINKDLGLESLIKWPNDIVVRGKKVCGILAEMSTEMDYINHIVVGIGINANTQVFPEEIKEKATSLSIEKGNKIVRAELIACTMREFEKYYQRFLETNDLQYLIEEYNSRLVNYNKEVVIQNGGMEIEAISHGINQKGELLVRTKEGEEKTIMAGEVSVRGIYGYV